jgi:cytosine/adenosine deaminase-related metal-dependent hydrolase
MLMTSFAVNRVTQSGRVAGPEQRIGFHDALRAVTIEAAYSWNRENELGSIEVGKIANLTVLDEDPYDAETRRLGEIPIRTTMFEGRVFDVDPELIAQRCASSVPAHQGIDTLVSPSAERGCGCEVAAFIGDHVTSQGWAA